jgi:hypothetical protein
MANPMSPADHAAAIEQARHRLMRFVQQCTDGDWRSAPVAGDPRTVGVIADHVAHSYEYLAGWIADLAAGKPVEVNPEVVDALNAEHAAEAGAVTQAHVTGHVRSSGDAMIALVAGLAPEELDLEDGRVGRLAAIAARHADSHRTELEAALAAIG